MERVVLNALVPRLRDGAAAGYRAPSAITGIVFGEADPPSAATFGWRPAFARLRLVGTRVFRSAPTRQGTSKIGSPHFGAREISPRFGLAALFFAETKILAHLVGIRSQPQCFGKICAGLRVAAMITEKHTKLERNFWTIGQQASSCL